MIRPVTNKNILIFADGTGNVGGLLPDESRTNVYKLFRATRTGPDSPIDPAQQVAFYIAGVGTSAPGESTRWTKSAWRRILQTIGGGLTRRIVDGYVAIISVWQPGDRIYLFGFSRGAYTARCIANVLECAGIPTQQPNGQSLSLEPTSLRAVAKEGVRTRYRLGMPIKDEKLRDAAATAFRNRYACAVGGQPIGAIPYFIGVWDTVVALGWNHFLISWLVRKIRRDDHPYDRHFPKDVPYARHAMAIDEYRKDFVRVPWGGSGTVSYDLLDGVQRFDQVWFAGNHADIGGSYPENESRLSDISLQWMADLISKELPEAARIHIQSEQLRCFPYSDGMMHDELMAGVGTHHLHLFVRGDRQVDPGGTLHPSVLERLKMERVRNYVGFGPYRPKPLEEHPKAKEFYVGHQSRGEDAPQSDSVSK
jgi:uncharacterized protein (DUF2235 family)